MTSAELYRVIDRDDLRQLCAVEDEQAILTPPIPDDVSPRIQPLALKCLMNDSQRVRVKKWKTLYGSK